MLKISIFITSLLIISTAWAQSDSLVFDNNLVIVGEIKNLNRGVITIETDYSDSDFKIEWIKVREIYSSAEYIISLATAERTVGKLSTDSLNKSRVNIWSDGKLYSFDIHDVVYIKPVKEGFLQRLSASIDFGFTLTKTNNLKQFTTRSNLGYLTDRLECGCFI